MPTASPLRQRLRRLVEEHPRLLELAFARSPLWRGQVHDLARRCGKPSCRCTRGHLHVTPVLFDRSADRPRTLTLKGPDLSLFTRLTEDYRALRQARARLVRIHREILEIFDALDAERRRRAVERHGARRPPRGPT